MHAAGWLESGLVSCYEKFIVDIEILRMLHEEFTPLEVDEESLAFSAHEEVGAGGHFLGAVHTLERFRECFYRPLLSSTANYERWSRDGGKDAAARASDDLEEDARRVRGAGARSRPEGRAEGLRRPPPHRTGETEMATVGEIMSRELLSVEAGLPLAEAAKRIDERARGRGARRSTASGSSGSSPSATSCGPSRPGASRGRRSATG